MQGLVSMKQVKDSSASNLFASSNLKFEFLFSVQPGREETHLAHVPIVEINLAGTTN
jgi:hypothetical protein